MIRVNLLPEDRRPVERTPLPRLLIIFFGVFIVGLEIVGLVYYYLLAIPNANNYLASIEANIPNYKAQAMQVKEMKDKIQKLNMRKDAVVKLWRERREWAPIFERIRDVIPDQIWLRSFGLRAGNLQNGVDIVIDLQASATGQTPRRMLEEVTNFMRAIEADPRLKEELVKDEPVGLGALTVIRLARDASDPKRPENAMEFRLIIKLRKPGTSGQPAAPGT